MTEGLVHDVSRLLDQAIGTARTPQVADELTATRDRLHGPLRVAICGKVKAGKSTLLNALLGEELATTDAGECTRIVTWYAAGPAPRVLLHPQRGPAEPAVWHRASGALDIDLAGHDAADLERISVTWPTSRLRQFTMLDTPGTSSISADVSERTHRAMGADGRTPAADAVIYLIRQAHPSDVRFLESFRDTQVIQGTAMNSVGVLARADEIGSCRPDAMTVAHRIAERYQTDPRVRRVCPVVVPVNALLAFTASTLREAEFGLLRRLTSADSAAVDRLLLTADRFLLGRSFGSAADLMTEIERRHLMERFGLYGLRIGVELIRQDLATSATAMAEVLSDISGLTAINGLLARQFAARSRVLKAASALGQLRQVVRDDSCFSAGAIESELERIQSTTHDFAEIGLLTRLHSGELDLSTDQSDELERLLGGHGHDPRTRLGLTGDATAADVTELALDRLDHWHRTAAHPLTSRPLRSACQVATRTLESILDDLSASVE